MKVTPNWFILMNFRCLQETSHSGVGVNKNSKGFIIKKSTDTSLSMIVAFSKIRVYGWFALQETISSEEIKYFYSEIYKAKSTLFRDECTPILVCDNAKYHKSESIKNFIDGSKARIFTLVPYSPFLNPAEQMIGYIKSKIKKELLRGK